MALTEEKILGSVNVKVAQNAIDVEWWNLINRDGEIISRTFHNKAFCAGQRAEFEAEVEGAANYVGLIDWTVLSNDAPQ
jgi:hypothetical protein